MIFWTLYKVPGPGYSFKAYSEEKCQFFEKETFVGKVCAFQNFRPLPFSSMAYHTKLGKGHFMSQIINCVSS